jgi:hypothetical protein
VPSHIHHSILEEDPMNNRTLRSLVLVALAPLLALAACEHSPTGTDDHAALGRVVILDRSTVPHTPIATWNHATGWDRATLMQVSHAAEANRTRVSLGVQVFTRGGEQIGLTGEGEYSVRYGVATDPAGVVDMNRTEALFHGDHVHIYGRNDTRATGTAQIVFALWHIDHSDGETAPVGITFVP